MATVGPVQVDVLSYICGKSVDLTTMEVDHIIPESLEDEPDRLAEVLRELGRPADFALNSYANWLPSCKPCNGLKSDIVFDPSLIVQLLLQKVAKKAAKAEQVASETLSNRKISRLLNDLVRANDSGQLDETAKETLRRLFAPKEDLRTLLEFVEHRREPALVGAVLRLGPQLEVLHERDGLRIIKGPYGIGTRPIARDLHPSFACPRCGPTAWEEARCVGCGTMDDDL